MRLFPTRAPERGPYLDSDYDALRRAVKISSLTFKEGGAVSPAFEGHRRPPVKEPPHEAPPAKEPPPQEPPVEEPPVEEPTV